jgi:hypothetical protein
MKKLFFFSFLFLHIIFTTYGQFIKPNEVPVKTSATLLSNFSDVKLPLWKKMDGDLYGPAKYEATFTYENKRTWVTIDSIGNLYAIETALDRDSLPEFARKYLKDKHEDLPITDSRIIYLSDRTFILVVVKGWRAYHSVLFNKNGNFISDKSSLLSYMVSAIASGLFIPDFGIFKPYKLRDSMVGPRKINYHSETASDSSQNK